MRFNDAIDLYVRDMRSEGRINSDRTVLSYRHTLERHSQDVDNRDPALTNRDDVKRTLRRWPNPNTQRTCRSILVSFYDWTVEEGLRPSNPARQTRRPKKRPTNVYRLTLDEVRAMIAVCADDLERRAIVLGVCGGFRSAELRGLQGQHFRRPGWVWVSEDIAKGGRERWVPVIADMAPVVAEIATSVADDEFVLPAQRWRNPGVNTTRTSLVSRPMSAQGLYYLVQRVGARAGINTNVHPHLLRHAYGDHVAKRAGLLVAQAVLGHASVETTRGTYVGRLSLDEIQRGVSGVSYGPVSTQSVLPPSKEPQMPYKAPTGIEPVQSVSRPAVRDLGKLLMNLRGAFADAC